MSVLKVPGLPDPIAVESIICVEGYENYAWLHIIKRPKYLLATTLKWAEAQLPSFIRTHKSSLINPIHVARVRIEGAHSMTIHMTNGMTIAVARRRIEQVRQQLRTSAKSNAEA